MAIIYIWAACAAFNLTIALLYEIRRGKYLGHYPIPSVKDALEGFCVVALISVVLAPITVYFHYNTYRDQTKVMKK